MKPRAHGDLWCLILAATGTLKSPPESNPGLQRLGIAGLHGNKGSDEGIRAGNCRKRVLNMSPAKINGKLLVEVGLSFASKVREGFVLFEAAQQMGSKRFFLQCL